MSYLLNYDAIAIFNEMYYKDLLTQNHIIDGETLFKTLSDSDGDDLGFNLPGYPLQKDGVKYLLPSKTSDEEGSRELNLENDLPIIVKKKQKIFSGGVGYIHIKKYASAKFRPEMRMSFRELVDKLSTSLAHSNQEHYKLYWIISLASMIDRVNFRLSTPAGFGKDSIVDIMNNLFGNATTISNPTAAKLEYLSFSKWLAINEVVGVTKAKWELMEQFLLDAGALKNKVAKQSRAVSGVGEFLDIRNLSISLFYNDIDHYPQKDKYFDVVTKKAVKDRFVQLRLSGTYTENFNEVVQTNLKQFVKDNMGEYDDIIRTFIYYKHNINNSLHYYKTPEMKGFGERHKTSLGRILNLIDVYSNSQEEFDNWWKVIKACYNDYNDMLEYPQLIEQAEKKHGKVKTETLIKGLKKINFTMKKKLLNQFIVGEQIKQENEFW